MAWLVLIVGGLLEVAWASLLPATRGFTRPAPTVLFIAALAASMYALNHAARTIPLGTAYAVWVGIGAVGTALVGFTVRSEPITLPHTVALAGLVAAIVAVETTTP